MPDCGDACHHGQCVAPSTCECYEGYKKVLETDSCQPQCIDGCFNGTNILFTYFFDVK